MSKATKNQLRGHQKIFFSNLNSNRFYGDWKDYYLRNWFQKINIL